MNSDELAFRLERVAGVQGVDCPHLLIEAAKRIKNLSEELAHKKRALSLCQKKLKRY